MTTDNRNDRQSETQDQGDDTVSALMNLAGPRADIPPGIEKRVHDAVHGQWQTSTRNKNIVRWAVPLSMAATVLIVMSFGMRSPEVLQPSVGTVAFAVGSSDLAGAPFEVGDIVRAGDTLETGTDSGVSIALSGDVSLRVAAGSSIQFDRADEISLLYGQIYADSGERIYRDRHLTITTPDGSATDIGTQFSVAVSGSVMSVAVREGRVDVTHKQSAFTATAGNKLVLKAGSDVEVDQVSPNDASWDWAISLAPEFDITNRSLLDFLKWAARETGKSLRFANDDVRMTAMRTQIVGSIKNFTPAEAIESVLATTRFHYEVDEQSITISE